MTLEAYIAYRTGADSISQIVRNMIVKPFMASSLRSFWNYWNPGYGYFLLYYCYKPLRKLFSDGLSLLITFLICGMLHDLIYILPMLLQANGSVPIPFVTIWFVLIAFGLLISDYFRLHFKGIAPKFRPLLHIGFLGSTFYATLCVDTMISNF